MSRRGRNYPEKLKKYLKKKTGVESLEKEGKKA
jgi:hypothetical protein